MAARPVAISMGDPSGIGPEVVLASLAALDPGIRVVMFGDWRFSSQACSQLPDIQRVTRAEEARGRFSFVDLALGQGPLRWGTIDGEYGAIALRSIEAALDAVEGGHCSALVTAPIHKQSIALAGAITPGHTELLAARAGREKYGRDYAMYFDSPKLKVALLTVHEPLSTAIASITAEGIVELVALVDREYRRLHHTQPRIALAALNPHGGEEGRFGSEEREIARAALAAQGSGFRVTGPHPADTLFLAASRGAHDVVIAMYHDQGLIPVKTLDFEHSVNVTLGLPWLRCSVDHGTAFDIAGKQMADPAPMTWAIHWAATHAGKWA